MSQPPSFGNIGLTSSSDQYFMGTKPNDLVMFSYSNASAFVGQSDSNHYVKVDTNGISMVAGGSNVCNFSSNVIAMSNVAASNVTVPIVTSSNITCSNITCVGSFLASAPVYAQITKCTAGFYNDAGSVISAISSSSTSYFAIAAGDATILSNWGTFQANVNSKGGFRVPYNGIYMVNFSARISYSSMTLDYFISKNLGIGSGITNLGSAFGFGASAFNGTVNKGAQSVTAIIPMTTTDYINIGFYASASDGVASSIAQFFCSVVLLQRTS